MRSLMPKRAFAKCKHWTTINNVKIIIVFFRRSYYAKTLARIFLSHSLAIICVFRQFCKVPFLCPLIPLNILDNTLHHFLYNFLLFFITFVINYEMSCHRTTLKMRMQSNIINNKENEYYNKAIMVESDILSMLNK